VATNTAPALPFSVTDVSGKTVNVTAKRWNDKVCSSIALTSRGKSNLLKAI